jgi:hypothetical protein
VRSTPAGLGAGMPSPHPTNRQPNPPTSRQLRTLRELAHSRGQTFTNPATKAEASAEIKRLQAAPGQDRVDRQIEADDLARVLVPRDATAIREREVTGYGANAHWAHTSREARS